MACEVKILGVHVVSSWPGGFAREIEIVGWASDCREVHVTIECLKAATSGNAIVDSSTGDWYLTLTTPVDIACVCGEQVKVFAHCVEDPQGCTSEPLVGTLDCPGAVCPEISDIAVQVDGCIGDGSSATVTLTAAMTAGAGGTNCEYLWDFGDGSADVTTSGRVATHTYTAAGTYPVGLLYTCGSCRDFSTKNAVIEACCLAVESVTAQAFGCAGPDASATINASASPANAGTYEWFLDGNNVGITTNHVSPPIDATSAGPHTVSVTYFPGGGCPETSASDPVVVDACSPGRDDDDDDDDDGRVPPPRDPWGCAALVWIAVILLALGVIALAIGSCIAPPPATYLIIIGIICIVLYGILMAIWALLRWFGVCAMTVCQAATIHMGVLGPVLAILSFLLIFLVCLNVNYAITILAVIAGVWGTIAANCLLNR